MKLVDSKLFDDNFKDVDFTKKDVPNSNGLNEIADVLDCSGWIGNQGPSPIQDQLSEKITSPTFINIHNFN